MNKQKIKLDIINLVLQSEEEEVLKTVLNVLKTQQDHSMDSLKNPLLNNINEPTEDSKSLQNDIDEIFNLDL